MPRIGEGRRRAWAGIVAANIALCLPLPARSEDTSDLNRRAVALYNAGKLGEAISVAEHTLHLRESELSPDHPDIATSLNNLAFFYQAEGRLRDAEPLYKRALEIREQASPLEFSAIVQSLNNLASLYQAQGL